MSLGYRSIGAFSDNPSYAVVMQPGGSGDPFVQDEMKLRIHKHGDMIGTKWIESIWVVLKW